ncbi:L-serine ammonia-lyase, iron-sulfur-dependent subunit beta [Aneurinibacillus aneurinilyticus]|jgi:L-serine dehydratase|uniref:L-serine ammonia-lyase, iron-sulfur-dependent subunit beta n=1 Tax=Aneurinibacillus aneurinilyticus TaxID=1391 RepID=UPI0023F0E5E7|nr:L-serine ammonia-lyase, iron-sulfur-dependent subunit beta [Aneurinibacillus aneurinilyticus]MCI1695094.1 L-serine ammonia-lyase, iron-sulfur-dependent subunit beta [Aneurinibacillus aneurinilyticus]
MKYRSVFDIIGPIMIGPSSSHTAGAARIGLLARNLFGNQPTRADILFYGSFAKTYKGHGTDIAIVGGILGFDTFDKRITESLSIAQEQHVDIIIRTSDDIPNHPNTARVTISDETKTISVCGISIGGGKMEITEVDDFPVRITGDMPTLLVWHEDRYGMVAAVSEVLAAHKINIGYMDMARKSRGAEALMVIETDQVASETICQKLCVLPYINRVSSIPAL